MEFADQGSFPPVSIFLGHMLLWWPFAPFSLFTEGAFSHREKTVINGDSVSELPHKLYVTRKVLKYLKLFTHELNGLL